MTKPLGRTDFLVRLLWFVYFLTGPILLWFLASFIEGETRGVFFAIAAVVSFACLYVVPLIALAPLSVIIYHEQLKAKTGSSWYGYIFGAIGSTQIPVWSLFSLLVFPVIAIRIHFPSTAVATKIGFVFCLIVMVMFLISVGLSFRARKSWKDFEF